MGISASPNRLAAAALFAGGLIVLAPFARGFALLDLWARTKGFPEIALRLSAVLFVLFAVAFLWTCQRKHPRTNDVVVFVVLSLLAGGTLLGSFGKHSWWLELFSHFRMQYAAGLVGVAACFALLGRRRWGAVASGLALVNIGMAAPQLVSWTPVQARGELQVRMVMANVHKGNENAERVLRFLHEEEAQVVVLEEFTPGWQNRLAWLGKAYPHAILVPRGDGQGIALFSQHPILSHEILRFAGSRYPSIAARLDVSGRDIVVVGAHPPAPRTEAHYRARNRIFEGLSKLARETHAPLVVLGDLNSTPWGHSFRRLVAASRLEDTSEGRGLQWSWPAGFWPLAIPIDHCLVSGNVDVLRRRMGPDIGSDHYPLVVDLAFGRGPGELPSRDSGEGSAGSPIASSTRSAIVAR